MAETVAAGQEELGPDAETASAGKGQSNVWMRKKPSRLASSPMSTMYRWPRCWLELLGYAHHVDFNHAVSGAMRLSALHTG